MQCPRCQTENPEGKKFCSQCGTKLLKVCPQCGAQIVPGRQILRGMRANFVYTPGITHTKKFSGKVAATLSVSLA